MILVTGGAGFIGSNIAAALSDRGQDVAVTGRLRRDDRWRNLSKHVIRDVVAPEQTFDWLQKHGHRVEAVVHMGAISATTETDADAIVTNNIRLSIDLWDWCTAAGVPLIYASSAATYGDGSAGFDDDFTLEALARLHPLNPYGWSKHFFDRRIAQSLSRGEAAPPQWAGLKFFNVYGPNEYHKGSMRSVVAQNYGRLRDGEPLRLFRSHHPDYSDGGQMRDFVYVRDVVDVVLWLLDRRTVSGLFNVGAGEARSWLDLGRAMFKALERPEAIEFIDMPEQIRPRYQYFTEAKVDRLRAAGYSAPITPLDEGIGDYVRSYLMRDDPYR